MPAIKQAIGKISIYIILLPIFQTIFVASSCRIFMPYKQFLISSK